MINDQVSDNTDWSDIFNGIASEAIPLKYVESVTIIFKNTKQFEIPVTDLEKHWDSFLETLSEFLLKYKDKVDSISYNINLNQIQHDITNLTTKFLAKYNL